MRRPILRFPLLPRLRANPLDEFTEAADFPDRVPDVWAYPNHNWLRITRVLKSLTLLGLEEEARSLFRRLDEVYSSRRFPVTAETFGYWEGR